MADKGTRERLIAVTIAMIDERGGVLPVSLREVSRRAGCAAPNVYNHFTNFAALLNSAHRQIIDDFNERVPAHALSSLGRDGPGRESLIAAAARAFVEYALAHRGWFNCFFFERHPWPADPETENAADATGQRMIELVRQAAPGPIEHRKAAWATRAIYSYLLGELAPIATGRLEPGDPRDYADRLAGGCETLFAAILAAPLNDERQMPEW